MNLHTVKYAALTAAAVLLVAPRPALADDHGAVASVPTFGSALGLPDGRQPKFVFIGAGVLRAPMNLTSLSGREKCNETNPIGCPPLPGLQAALSATFGIGLSPSVLGFIDLQAVTGFSNFNPQPSLGVGPAIMVAPRFLLNPQFTYAPSFYYSNGAAESARPKGALGETNHSVALSLAFGFIRPPLLICPLIAGVYDATSEQWSMILALKVGVPLAIL